MEERREENVKKESILFYLRPSSFILLPSSCRRPMLLAPLQPFCRNLAPEASPSAAVATSLTRPVCASSTVLADARKILRRERAWRRRRLRLQRRRTSDIFFTNGAQTPSLEKAPPNYANRLYRNDGEMKFTDVTEPRACGVSATPWAPRRPTTTTTAMSTLRRRRAQNQLCAIAATAVSRT